MSEMHSTLEGASQGVPAIKNLPADAGDVRDAGLIPGSGISPPVFLPGESHGPRSLGGYSPQGRTESDTSEAT